MIVLCHQTAIKADDYITISKTKTRKKHRWTLVPYAPPTHCLKFSFFPRTINEWNELPSEAVSVGEAELFRARLDTHM